MGPAPLNWLEIDLKLLEPFKSYRKLLKAFESFPKQSTKRPSVRMVKNGRIR